MALANSDILDTPEEQSAAARDFRRQQVEALKADQLNTPKPTPSDEAPTSDQSGGGNPLQRGARAAGLLNAQKSVSTVSGPAQAAALQAYKRLWWGAHETLEDLALAFFGLTSLILGGPVIALFLFRAVAGNLLGGFGTFERDGLSIPRIPPMDIIEFPYRAGKTIFIALVTGLFWATLTILLYFLTNPREIINVFGIPQLGDFFWEMLKRFGLSNVIGGGFNP